MKKIEEKDIFYKSIYCFKKISIDIVDKILKIARNENENKTIFISNAEYPDILLLLNEMSKIVPSIWGRVRLSCINRNLEIRISNSNTNNYYTYDFQNIDAAYITCRDFLLKKNTLYCKLDLSKNSIFKDYLSTGFDISAYIDMNYLLENLNDLFDALSIDYNTVTGKVIYNSNNYEKNELSNSLDYYIKKHLLNYDIM